MTGRRYVIVGDGAAGISAVRTLRHRDLNATITLVAEEPHAAYYRAALTNYLLGELRDDQLWSVPPGFFTDHRIGRRHARAVGVDTEGQRLTLHDGSGLAYDALLIASGARARAPTFSGSSLAGVVTLRTLQDAQRILEAARDAKSAVVIGGGPLAIELATALVERGLRTVLLVRGQRLLSGALDAVASDLVVARMQQLGIDVRLGHEVEEALGKDDVVRAVRTRAGDELPCDLLGVAIGVVPNSEWLRDAVALERGSIVVDEHLRTSAPKVWAAGDVARAPGNVLQLWEPAQRQGRSAATSMTGGDAPYRVGAHYFATRLGDLDFASIGSLVDEEADDVIVQRDATKIGAIAYRKLWLANDRVIGAVMLGHRDERVRRRGRMLGKLIERRVNIASVRDRLLDAHFDIAGFMRQSRLLEPPPAVVTDTRRKSSVVRGTQTVRIDTPASHAPEAFAPTVAGALLSTGFRAPSWGSPALAHAEDVLESAAQRFPIERRRVIIGRGKLSDITLQDPAVSERHATVEKQGKRSFLRDLGSRHGTWVNDALVTTPHLLAHGDRIRVGATDLRWSSSAGRSTDTPAAALAPPPTKSACLHGVGGSSLGLFFALEPGRSNTVGRDAGSTVRLDDISVSRRHAVIGGHGGSWTITDLHSSRGSLRNGARLEPGHDEPLAHGDELTFGAAKLRFEMR